MSNNRRSQDANAPRPAMKVVGFRVEGVPPSPDQLHSLAETTEGGGSPDPVIIPPAFQGTDSDRSVPVSPRRTNTLPSYVPDGGNSSSKALRDVLWDEDRYNSGRESRDKSPANQRLISSTSLPPFTDAEQMNVRRQAGGTSEEDSPAKDPKQGFGPISPFRGRGGDQVLSSSYRAPGYSMSQQRRKPDLAQLSATFSHGHRFPENMGQGGNRPIKVHMGATNSDGSKIISPGQPNPSSDFSTPRVQHGFQLYGKAEESPVSASPFASRSSQTLPASELGTLAEESSSDLNKQAPAAADPRRSTAAEGSQASGQATPSEPATPRPSEIKPREPSDPANIPAASTASKSIPLPGKKGSQSDPSIEDRRKVGQGEKKLENVKEEKKKEGKADKGRDAQQGVEEKKKPTKAERRAIQEKQRADKAAAKEAQDGGKKPQQEQAAKKQATVPQIPPQQRAASQSGLQSQPPNPKTFSKAKSARPSTAPGQTSEMFAHLQQFKSVTTENVFETCSTALKVHPAILQLGLNIASGEISGGNARCLAMLLAFKAFIQDYQTPESKEMGRDLTSQVNLSVQFLVECRPLSMSMGTAIKNLKLKITNIDHTMEHEEAKEMLLSEIDTFIQEKITFADRSVADLAQSKIENRDVVLTFAYSSAVVNTFIAARQAGKRFRAIVVDSRPHYEGRIVLQKLSAAGIPCTYLQLNAICFIMKEVTKVFMGASGALSNGTIVARIGSAIVALAAHAMQRPVIICCETLKFVDRVQLDSITNNELGNPKMLAHVEGRPGLDALKDWEDQPHLEVLNLMYDAMPAKFVSMLVTEVGAIPPTSIPVILREYRVEPRI